MQGSPGCLSSTAPQSPGNTNTNTNTNTSVVKMLPERLAPPRVARELTLCFRGGVGR